MIMINWLQNMPAPQYWERSAIYRVGVTFAPLRLRT